MSSRDIITKIEQDGWYVVRQKGSHVHFKHKHKPGVVTVPHPNKDLCRKTERSILRQAGLI